MYSILNLKHLDLSLFSFLLTLLHAEPLIIQSVSWLSIKPALTQFPFETFNSQIAEH